MITFLAVACVVLVVLLICGGLAAFDLITQLDEDLENARTDRGDYQARLEQMSARCVHLQAENTDLAFALDALLDPTEKPARHLKSVPAADNIIRLTAANEAARHLSDDQLTAWLNSWETPENGDPA